MDKIVLVLPTYNASKNLGAFLSALSIQTIQPTLLAIDSSSTDNTKKILKTYGFNIHQIPQKEFNHGGTRQLATTLIDADVYIFMTQDAILASDQSLEHLITALNQQDDIACAFGRQLPKADANVLSIHGRYANYPNQSYTRYIKDKNQYGIKTCFNSNNLAAYKKLALSQIGGFPKSIITSEDAYVAAKLLQAGYAIHYAADATIYHSHNLSLIQEFHRYFSIGVFHGKENWIIKEFNSATNEGWKFVLSEIKYLYQENKLHYLPKALLSTMIKFLAYKCGMNANIFPYFIKRNLGINKNYWIQNYE